MRAANPNAGTSWPSRLPTILAWSALLLAGLLCIWMLVQLAWSLFTPLTPELTGTPARAPITQADSTQGDISRWHLFGNGNANALKRDIMEAGQATQLKLTLHGTVSEDQGQGGYALIADANGMEHSYRVGDRIQQGVSLKAVRADHVVLEHNGRNERLDLPRESLDSASSVRPLGHSGGTLTNSAGAQAGRTAGLPRPRRFTWHRASAVAASIGNRYSRSLSVTRPGPSPTCSCSRYSATVSCAACAWVVAPAIHWLRHTG